LVKDNTNKYFFAGAVLLVVFDQVTKLMIKGFDFLGIHVSGMSLGETISLIGDFARITYIENKGMAFGIEFGIWKIFLSLFSIIASIALIIYLNRLKNHSPWVRAGIMFVLAGAAGNLVDRVFYGVLYDQAPLFYGSVVDFIQVDIPDVTIFGNFYTHWPVFNVADSCVTVGVVLLILFHKRIPTLAEVFPKLAAKQSNQSDVQ